MAMELTTTNLVQPKEIFARLDPKRVTEQLGAARGREADPRRVPAGDAVHRTFGDYFGFVIGLVRVDYGDLIPEALVL